MPTKNKFAALAEDIDDEIGDASRSDEGVLPVLRSCAVLDKPSKTTTAAAPASQLPPSVELKSCFRQVRTSGGSPKTPKHR